METKRYCEQCKMEHTDVADLTDDEFNSFQFINNRVITAQKYVTTGASQSVVLAAIQVEADSLSEMNKWWREIGLKYGFEAQLKEYMVDFLHKKVYYNA